MRLVLGLTTLVGATLSVAWWMTSRQEPGDARDSMSDPEASTPVPGDRPAATTGHSTASSLVAQARRDAIEIYAAPGDPEPERELRAADAVTLPDHTPMVLLVKDRPAHGWLEVLLPIRPNGSTGFIHVADVSLTEHAFRVQIDLSDRWLRVYEGDHLRVDHAVGVGRRDAPTPGGVYYIKELLEPPDPNGVYGTFAYGLSGFSNALESFSGGPAIIGIHGTNDPSSIGTEASSGCIRLPNDVIEQMVGYLPLGTPVEIRA